MKAQSAESGLWFNSPVGIGLARLRSTYVRRSCLGRPRALHHRAVVPTFVQHHAHHCDEGDLHAGNHATLEKPTAQVCSQPGDVAVAGGTYYNGNSCGGSDGDDGRLIGGCWHAAGWRLLPAWRIDHSTLSKQVWCVRVRKAAVWRGSE